MRSSLLVAALVRLVAYIDHVFAVTHVVCGYSYTKLKDVEKLDEFVKHDTSSTGLTFDVKTAISVCRQANYQEHALFLARKYGEHELYLRIQ